MRVLIPLFIFFSFSAQATECHLWSIKGKVIYQKPHFILLSAEATQSETRLILPLEEQHKLAGFLDQAVEAKILLAEKEVPKKGNVLKVEGAERIVPDPLNDNQTTIFKKLGSKPCP